MREGGGTEGGKDRGREGERERKVGRGGRKGGRKGGREREAEILCEKMFGRKKWVGAPDLKQDNSHYPVSSPAECV